MTTSSQENAYFEALGEPKPGQPYGTLEQYRFRLAFQHLAQGSVLDVGVFFGDFLKLALRDGRKIMGTEVNKVRVDLANSLLGQDAVVVDFRHGRLSQFGDDSVDNVVATEVIEHVRDIRTGLSELCRAARRRVILTVPLREVIKSVLCIHCNNYTPYSGHLHAFDFGSFAQLIPSNWIVAKEMAFGSRAARWFAARLPSRSFTHNLMQLLDGFQPKSGQWLLAVLEPAGNHHAQLGDVQAEN
jgi:SAM-dependent methyltransferase